ncbi:hypothetical protein AGMMS50268_20390 [Spirochaetia bacterium]|nr:hypothetical protein AGMMS50268_20390 [Spirochaetia bacterium]
MEARTPAEILAKSNPVWAEQSHVGSEALTALNWGSFVIRNLLPVSLGNITGGAGMVGGCTGCPTGNAPVLELRPSMAGVFLVIFFI